MHGCETRPTHGRRPRCRCRALLVLLALGAAAGLSGLALPPPSARALVTFDFEQRYFVHPGRQVWDFCLIRPDSVYNLFYHTIPEDKPGAANADTIWRATSPDLVHWEIRGPVLTSGPGWYDRGAMWAPDVVWDPVRPAWIMLYTGVDSLMNQRACVAYSNDLQGWLKSFQNPVLEPDSLTYYWSPTATWSSFRDPFLWEEDGLWHLLNTAQLRVGGYPGTRRGVLHLATSSNLVHWLDQGVFFAHDGELQWHELESSQYHVRGAHHHLFFAEVNVPGTSHLAAGHPDSFTMADWHLLERGGAPEIDSFEPGVELFSRLGVSVDPLTGNYRYVVRIDTLEFAGGGAEPAILKPHPLAGRWATWEGTATLAQPTFGDNTAARGLEPCGLVGHGWFGSAEYYQGPLSGVGAEGSFLGDAATGTAVSRQFEVTGDQIRLRVGGGHFPATCYVALVDPVDGRVLFSATGVGGEPMTERVWDVRSLRGVKVQITIVDQETAEGGHINVDDIREVLDPLSGGLSPVRGPLAAHGAAPNPGNPAVNLRFALTEAASARVSVHDLRGRRVWRSPVAACGPGEHAVRWDGRDAAGRAAAAGTYLYAVELNGRPAATGKLTLVK